MTTTIVMAAIPVFYYAIKNRWAFWDLVYRLVVLGGGAVLSSIVSIIIITLQYVLLGKTFSDGLHHLYNSFLKRTHIPGEGIYTDWVVEASTQEPVWSVVSYYFYYPLILDFTAMGIDYSVTIRSFLYIFLTATVIWILFAVWQRGRRSYRNINVLCAVLWLSILAPLSWFVIFKAHSFVHREHNPIVWFMPFMFFGVGFLGVVIDQFVRAFWRSANKSLNT